MPGERGRLRRFVRGSRRSGKCGQRTPGEAKPNQDDQRRRRRGCHGPPAGDKPQTALEPVAQPHEEQTGGGQRRGHAQPVGDDQ